VALSCSLREGLIKDRTITTRPLRGGEMEQGVKEREGTRD